MTWLRVSDFLLQLASRPHSGLEALDTHCRSFKFRRSRLGIGDIDGEQIGVHFVGEMHRHEYETGPKTGVDACMCQ